MNTYCSPIWQVLSTGVPMTLTDPPNLFPPFISYFHFVQAWIDGHVSYTNSLRLMSRQEVHHSFAFLCCGCDNGSYADCDR